ncbi:ribonuclease III [Bacteroidota bacterium]
MIKHIWYLIKLLFISNKKFYYFLYSTLGYLPSNIKLFKIAFIHKSASSFDQRGIDLNNERLEFLGDAILDAIIAEFLYDIYPLEDEGFLTKMKAKIVNRDMLNIIAEKIGIPEFIKSHTNNHHTNNHHTNNTYIGGNAFEAIIGATFLDKGYQQTKKFVIKKIVRKHIDLYELEFSISDYKSHLLEWGQKNKIDVEFDTSESDNYTDNKPEFVSKIIIEERVKGSGMGRSKKEAEQNASKKALMQLNIQD